MACDNQKYPVIAVTILLTLLVLRPVDSFDVWWHLNSGLWMITHGQILDHDPWSFTRGGEPWTNVAWIFQVVLALAYKIADVWGLFFFKAICLFTVFSLIALSTRIPRNVFAYILAFLFLPP